MHYAYTMHKGLANTKRRCGCSVLCLCPKRSLSVWSALQAHGCFSSSLTV